VKEYYVLTMELNLMEIGNSAQWVVLENGSILMDSK
jgi:hypothetical protein